MHMVVICELPFVLHVWAVPIPPFAWVLAIYSDPARRHVGHTVAPETT